MIVNLCNFTNDSCISKMCYGCFALICFIAVIYSSALLPKHIASLPEQYLLESKTEALAQHGLFASGYCTNAGLNIGVPLLQGVSYIYPATALHMLLPITADTANRIWGICLYLASFTMMIYMLTSLGQNKYISTTCAFVFFSMPIIYKSAGFGPTMYGFALLPFYVGCDWILFFKIIPHYRPKYQYLCYFAYIPYLIVKLLSVFMDGYSFMMYSVLSSFIFLAFLYLRHKEDRLRLFFDIFLFVLVHVTAFLCYKLYVPSSVKFTTMPIDFFRFSGIDLISLVVPTQSMLMDKWFGLANFFDYSSNNNGRNYIGFGLLFCLVFFIFMKMKQKDALILALVGAGLLGFVLSLGPSLKINDTPELPPQPQHEDYFMSSDEATLNLHTDFIYTRIPGIKNMRVVERWLLIPKYVLIVLAGFVVTALFQNKHCLTAFILLFLILVDVFPDYSSMAIGYPRKHRQYNKFIHDVIDDLKPRVNTGERVFFLSSENDYLANFIAQRCNIRCYNVGGDKNLSLAFRTWPQSLKELKNGTKINTNTLELLEQGTINCLILPFFNLRWDSYSWAPSSGKRQQTCEQMLGYFSPSNNVVSIEKAKWFALVRLRNNATNP